eukprot:snap_masked-scaffold_10-processed-gene-6.8-mRNA-1 protein AED:0.25 eAED:1.00 QI:0/-1/0/1/-1/1/1/0/190
MTTSLSEEQILFNTMKTYKPLSKDYEINYEPDKYLLPNGNLIHNIQTQTFDFQSLLNEAKLDGLDFKNETQTKRKKKQRLNFDLTEVKFKTDKSTIKQELTVGYKSRTLLGKNKKLFWVKVENINIWGKNELMKEIREEYKSLQKDEKEDIKLSDILESDKTEYEYFVGRMYLQIKFHQAHVNYFSKNKT